MRMIQRLIDKLCMFTNKETLASIADRYGGAGDYRPLNGDKGD